MTDRVRVVHSSDWHGNMRKLPEGDLYVFTGDMLPNWPSLLMALVRKPLVYGTYETRWMKYDEARRASDEGTARWTGDRTIEKRWESEEQERWVAKLCKGNGAASLRGVLLPESCRDNPVVVVRGNHDFYDFGRDFGGEVFEVDGDPRQSVQFCGLKVGGCRGINYIVGEWNDEWTEEKWRHEAGLIPRDLDLLATHAPPAGVLDELEGQRLGSDALARYHMRNYGLRAHLFGHIHCHGGKTQENAGCILSNAATATNVFDLEPR